MKVLKVYGSTKWGGNYTVYINGIETNIDEVENSIFFDNKHAFGYGCDNQLVVFEDETEKLFVNQDGVMDFGLIKMPYGMYKGLQKLPRSGFLRPGNYDKETKTIEVMCKGI